MLYRSTPYLSYLFSIVTFYFQARFAGVLTLNDRVDTRCSQVSYLLPPGACLAIFFRAQDLAFPLLVDFSPIRLLTRALSHFPERREKQKVQLEIKRTASNSSVFGTHRVQNLGPHATSVNIQPAKPLGNLVLVRVLLNLLTLTLTLPHG